MVLMFGILVLVIRIYLVHDGGGIAGEHHDSTVATGYQGERKEVSGEEDNWPAHSPFNGRRLERLGYGVDRFIVRLGVVSVDRSPPYSCGVTNQQLSQFNFATGIASTAATSTFLLGWTDLGAVRTVDAAVPRLGPQEFSTGCTVIEILAGVRRHGFYLPMVALRTGDRGLQVSS